MSKNMSRQCEAAKRLVCGVVYRAVSGSPISSPDNYATTNQFDLVSTSAPSLRPSLLRRWRRQRLTRPLHKTHTANLAHSHSGKTAHVTTHGAVLPLGQTLPMRHIAMRCIDKCTDESLLYEWRTPAGPMAKGWQVDHCVYTSRPRLLEAAPAQNTDGTRR